jgi:hypothetical protein
VGGALVITSGYLFYKAFVADSTPFSTSDARGSSLHLAPMISPNGMGAAAFATF